MLRRNPPPRFNPTKHDYIGLEGGFDTETPPLSLPTGRARGAQNFQALVKGGYQRIHGYERFDGQARPSAAQYAILTATITGAYSVGDTLTGLTSGATGVIVAATATYFVLTKVSGTYQAAEELQIAGTTRATASAAQVDSGASTTQLHAQYLNAAADEYRDDIAAVPGSGSILGVWLYNDVKYAFRNNAGGTAAVMHKSTSSGWSAVSLGFQLGYTTGTEQIAEGSTITGATSGASAVLKRQTVRTGTVGAGNAVGIFVFAAVTGTFQNGENLEVGGVTKAVASGTQAAITLLPDGRYEFENHNFAGTANTKRMYGCDSVNKAFEFDGTTFVPIATGMTTDTPRHITIHKEQLFLSFDGSVQHSGPGTPYAWTIVSGAGELAIGDTVTGFMKQPGSAEGKGALAILSRNLFGMLYGSSSSDWNLVTYADEQGAHEWSIQQIGMTIMLDDRGLTTLQTSANYGNFSHATISQQIQTWVNDQKPKLTASCISRERSQYRIFFNDSYALYITFDGKSIRGMMPVLYTNDVTCACSGEISDGTEEAYFGSSDGFVYQMDKGTSFDGDAIEAFIDLAYNHAKSPRQRKRYKKAVVEVQGEGYAEFHGSVTLGYGTTDITQGTSTSVVTSFAAVFWDSFVWDAFVWDGQTLMPSEFRLQGTAQNQSIRIYSNSDYFSPVTFSAVLVDYSERRRLR